MHKRRQRRLQKRLQKKNEKIAKLVSSFQTSDDEAAAAILKKYRNIEEFSTHVFIAITYSDYYLQDSHLLDSAVNAHICNKS